MDIVIWLYRTIFHSRLRDGSPWSPRYQSYILRQKEWGIMNGHICHIPTIFAHLHAWYFWILRSGHHSGFFFSPLCSIRITQNACILQFAPSIRPIQLPLISWYWNQIHVISFRTIELNLMVRWELMLITKLIYGTDVTEDGPHVQTWSIMSTVKRQILTMLTNCIQCLVVNISKCNLQFARWYIGADEPPSSHR